MRGWNGWSLQGRRAGNRAWHLGIENWGNGELGKWSFSNVRPPPAETSH